MRLRDFDSLREESAFATETFRSVTKSETFQLTMDSKICLIIKDPSIHSGLFSFLLTMFLEGELQEHSSSQVTVSVSVGSHRSVCGCPRIKGACLSVNQLRA